MKLTAKIKLKPNNKQTDSLLHTLSTCNAACNHISQVAWDTRTFSRNKLHHLVYYDVRARFGLSAQATVRCIAKVVDAYKLDRKAQRTFKPTGGVAYDNRLLRYDLAANTISIWTMAGRLTIPFVGGQRQLEQLQSQKGESDLLYLRGKFYLGATCDVKEAKPVEVEDVLGVDLGIKNIAYDRDGQRYCGAHLNNLRRRRRRQRKKIQKVGTKAARRKLKKMSGRERRHATNVNHVISKKIVKKAKDTNRAIAMEELTGIRSRVRLRKSQRDDLHSWAFSQLNQFVAYKAQRKGVPKLAIDPRWSSQECAVCGYIDQANRKTQSEFLCRKCGHADHADENAALVLRNRGRVSVNTPLVSDTNWVYACPFVAPGTSLRLLAVGS